MGRFLKNTTVKSANHALTMPSGTSATRPANPLPGTMRFNTSIDRLEVFNHTAWHSVSKEDPVDIVKDTFAGDDATVNFTMSQVYEPGEEDHVLVYLNTVWQNPGINYTFNGSTNIHFTSTPGVAAVIVVLHNFASTATTW